MLNSNLKGVFPGKPNHIGKINISFKKRVDSTLISKIEDFLSLGVERINALGFDKATVGLSGGVDSVVAAKLLHQAIGSNAFVVIVDFGDNEDTNFSVKIADKIGINYTLIKADQLFNKHLKLLKGNSTLSRIHLRSRIVNNIIFQVADNNSALVLDTTDKSERLLARHAESFMGHLAPNYDLYKTELYDITDFVNLSEVRLKEPGCPDLADTDAFGVDWETLDGILYLLTERKKTVDEIASKYAIDTTWLSIIEKRLRNQHLRTETIKLLMK